MAVHVESPPVNALSSEPLLNGFAGDFFATESLVQRGAVLLRKSQDLILARRPLARLCAELIHFSPLYAG
jgi:hypothetical protein